MNNYWKRANVDFSHPVKLWSSGGQWMPIKLICFIDNYAIVKIKYPIGKWGYKALDLTWYEEISTPKFEGQKVSRQLRNVDGKDQLDKDRLRRVKFASWICSKVLGGWL